MPINRYCILPYNDAIYMITLMSTFTAHNNNVIVVKSYPDPYHLYEYSKSNATVRRRPTYPTKVIEIGQVSL